MIRLRVLIVLLVLLPLGCAAPRPRGLGPPPAPLLGTRAPTFVEPIPPPVRPEPVEAVPVPWSLRNVTVVVDPGHGGKDPGALGVGSVYEKQVNLAIARELAWRLERSGARVVNSRTGDVFIELDARARLADQHRASLFVSIHADASRRREVKGTTLYISRDALPQSQRAAEAIARALAKHGVVCRGIRRAGFRVLVGHSRPAVLIETGFLTNAEEARRLAQPSYQALLATAIADGIGDHFARSGP